MRRATMKRKHLSVRPIAAPEMPRGETPFEEKRIACEFELAFKQIAEMGLASIKDTYEVAFRYGYVSGKITERGKHERLSRENGE